jgi:hypothetical protein
VINSTNSGPVKLRLRSSVKFERKTEYDQIDISDRAADFALIHWLQFLASVQ